jgi:hypothetical protein
MADAQACFAHCFLCHFPYNGHAEHSSYQGRLPESRDAAESGCLTCSIRHDAILVWTPRQLNERGLHVERNRDLMILAVLTSSKTLGIYRTVSRQVSFYTKNQDHVWPLSRRIWVILGDSIEFRENSTKNARHDCLGHCYGEHDPELNRVILLFSREFDLQTDALWGFNPSSKKPGKSCGGSEALLQTKVDAKIDKELIPSLR